MSTVVQWTKAEVKPAKVGLYERNYGVAHSSPDYWDGENWRYVCGSEVLNIAIIQDREWRELTEKPEAA
jgi:hypothetical protein